MVIRYASAESPRAPRVGGRSTLYAGASLPLRIRILDVVAQAGASLRRRIFRMALFAALPLAAALAYGAIQPSLYQTSASVFVDSQLARPGRPDAVDSGVISGQLRLATSKTVLQRAIDKEKFVEDSTFFARPTGAIALAKALMGLVRSEPASAVADRPAAVLSLVSQAVQVRRGDGANLIEVSAVAADPVNAMRISNAVAQSFVDELVAMADTTQGSERARLTRRGDDLKVRLRDAEAALNTYRVQNGMEQSATKLMASDQDAPSMLARARAASIEAKAKFEQIQKLLNSGKEAEAIADVVRSPSIDRLRIQYNEAAAQEASFRTSLGPRHPAYLEALQQAREKKRLLQEALRLSASAAKADWQAAREQETALETRSGTTVPVQTTQSLRPMQFQELERNVEIARAAYDRFVRSFDAPDAQAQSVVARVVAQAPLPMLAITGNSKQIWSLALAGSLGLAGLIGLFGIIRDMGRPSGQPAPTVRKAQSAKMAASSPAPVVRIRQPAELASEPVETPRQPPAPPQDPVEMIASDLARDNEEFPLQTVLVLGQETACATSDITIALARAARRLSLRVLVIDADDVDASLSHEWGSGPNAGLVTIQTRDRRAVWIDSETVARFCLIPSESALAPVHPGALSKFGGIAGNFDLVILQGPAMTGSILERKLARAAQTIVVGYSGEKPASMRVSEALGVPPESLRLISVTAKLDNSRATDSQPMAIVRLRKCA